MQEIEGNLWDSSIACDLRVITTNGATRKDGAAIMGRGCALEARNRFPGIDVELGWLITTHGNRVMRFKKEFSHGGARIASFPVKDHWKDAADPVLIRRSARQLIALADKFSYTTNILIPRPGCGNGKLSWKQVRPILSEVLDNRFTVIVRRITGC